MRSSLRLLFLFLLAAPLVHAGRPVDSPSYDLYLDKVLYDEAFFPILPRSSDCPPRKCYRQASSPSCRCDSIWRTTIS